MLRLCGPRGIEGLRRLSSRETQLIVLAGGGLTDKEIARRLGISVGTVITVWSKVRSKLGINSRVAAVAAVAWAIALMNGRHISGFDIAPKHERSQPETATLVLNHKLVVLTCDALAANTFEMLAGLTFDLSDAGVNAGFATPEGEPIERTGLPWAKALKEGRPQSMDLQAVGLIGGPKDFHVTCEVVEDPVFKSIAIVRFRRADDLALNGKSYGDFWDEPLHRTANAS